MPRTTDGDTRGRSLDTQTDSDGGNPTPRDAGPSGVTILADTPYSKAELEAACLGPDPALEKRTDSSGTYFVDLETKRRVYIDGPAEAPEGAPIQQGVDDGTFYETEDLEAFEEAMDAISERVRENMEFTDEQWEKAGKLKAEHKARSEEMFESVIEAADIPSGTKASHRVKSAPSMLEKVFEREGPSAESLDELGDVFGAKFVPGDIDEVYEVTDNLQANLEEEMDLAEVEIDDQLEPEESTYYRAVHIDFETEDGLVGEIQVKSEEMERIIDVGHDTVWKNNVGLNEEMQEEVDECLTAQMDALFGEDADPDEACTEKAIEVIREVA